MAADVVKSLSILNLDQLDTNGNPIVANSAGVGAPGRVVEQSDYCATTTAGLANTGSTYKMVRVPWNAKLKKLDLSSDAALDTSTGLALDVGAYYTDSLVEGLINAALAGTSVGGAVNQFYVAGTGFQSSAKGPISVMTALTMPKRNQPLWQALGLTSNPGGFCDIVVAVHTAATTGGVANIGIVAEYVE